MMGKPTGEIREMLRFHRAAVGGGGGGGGVLDDRRCLLMLSQQKSPRQPSRRSDHVRPWAGTIPAKGGGLARTTTDEAR